MFVLRLEYSSMTSLILPLPRGREHPSTQDPKLRVSGQLLDKNGIRITSAHWYHDGEVKYSKGRFNDAEGEA